MTDPVEISISNQMWGSGGTAPAGAPNGAPADAVLLYQGATQSEDGFSPWWAWDLRSIVLKMGWDLLRFFPITYGKPPATEDRAQPMGMRDTIARIWYLEDQNNKILKALAASAKVDISSILAE